MLYLSAKHTQLTTSILDSAGWCSPRTKTRALCQASSLLQVIGAPLAAGLLALDGYLGLAGWQWLFIVEGIPTVLMGIYTKVNLAESPAKASFLTPAEKAWLQQRHAQSKVRFASFSTLSCTLLVPFGLA